MPLTARPRSPRGRPGCNENVALKPSQTTTVAVYDSSYPGSCLKHWRPLPRNRISSASPCATSDSVVWPPWWVYLYDLESLPFYKSTVRLVFSSMHGYRRRRGVPPETASHPFLRCLFKCYFGTSIEIIEFWYNFHNGEVSSKRFLSHHISAGFTQ